MKTSTLQDFLDWQKSHQDAKFYTNFQKACEVFEIIKPDWFFIQCFYESAFFKRRLENLNYSSVARLRRVFGSRIPKDDKKAKLLVKNPKALADIVYKKFITGESGKDLTGWDMIGEDFLQLTGERNKVAFAEKTKIDVWVCEHWFAQPENSFMASGFYWWQKKIDQALSFEDCTKKITGKSMIAHSKRVTLLKKLYKLLS